MVLVFVVFIIILSTIFVLYHCIAIKWFCQRSDDASGESVIEDDNYVDVKLEMENLGNINFDMNIQDT